jgi:hypothetical protein
MTPAAIIAEVRRLIQDTKTPFRYSDTVLLGFVNQTLKKMVIIRPDLFSVITDIPTTPGTVVQSLPSDAMRLIEVFAVKGGNAVREVSRDMLDQTTPGWLSESAGTPVNFMRHVRNPYRYFLYPAPVAGVELLAEYAQTPPDYTLDATIVELRDAYLPVVVDGTVFLAESIDNEHVSSGRAKLFQDAFVQALGVSLQSRTITDIESAGLDPKEVI